MSKLTLATKIISTINCIYLFLTVLFLMQLRSRPAFLSCFSPMFVFIYFIVMDITIAILITQGVMKPNNKWRKWLTFLFCIDLIILASWISLTKAAGPGAAAPPGSPGSSGAAAPPGSPGSSGAASPLASPLGASGTASSGLASPLGSSGPASPLGSSGSAAAGGGQFKPPASMIFSVFVVLAVNAFILGYVIWDGEVDECTV